MANQNQDSDVARYEIRGWRRVVLKCISFGMWSEPFNRQEFSRKRFPVMQEYFSRHQQPERDIACALRDIYEFEVVNYEESKRMVAISNVRSLVAVWVAIISLIASVIVGVMGVRQSHEDSESTTRALVEALSDMKVH